MMKSTIKYVLFLVFAMFAATACTKTDPVNPYDRESSISIEESDLIFPVEGGEGYIKVNCESDYTLECGSSWIDCSKEGNIVKVTATANDWVLGRSATIMLRCGADSVKAVAQQVSYAFIKDIPEKIDADDKLSTYTYTYDAPYEVIVSTSDSWINAKLNGTKLTLTLQANQTGKARLGSVTITGKSEHSQTDVISISQYDFNGKVAGRYFFEYQVSEYDDAIDDMVLVEYSETVSISRDSETQAVSVTLANGFTVPLLFDPAAMTLSIRGRQYCGTEKSTSQTYYIYTTILDNNKHMQIIGDAYGMDAEIKTVTVDGKEKIRLEFKDNGEWEKVSAGHAATGFYLYRFTNPSAIYQYAAGNMAQYLYPVMTKM